MSLQIWLPLDGNLENEGISDVTITNNGATIDNFGKIGSCYSFNGSTSCIELSCNDFPTFFNGPFSVCMWFYNNDNGDRSILFGNWSMTGSFFNVEKFADNTTRFYWNGTPDIAFSSAILIPGVWTHLTVTRNGNTVKCYINGKLKQTSTTALTGAPGNTATTFRIGRDNRSDATATNGRISDFRLYNHALSDDEIKEIFSKYTTPTLICHLPLDKTDGSFTVYDESGYGNNGTLSTNKPTITSGAPKKYNSSMLFADNKYISISIPNITNSANSYTFSWWGKCTVYEAKMYWGFTDGNRLNLFGTGGGYCWNTGDGAQNKFTGTIFAYEIDGNWHHFAVTGNGTSTKLYIDGGFRANATTYKGITGTNIIINGWNTANDYNFNGQLSDFRIYASALSEEEIFELYNITNHPNLNSTVFTDTDSFIDTSGLYVKEIHLHELQNAITRLNTYLPNVDNCGYVNCCESCQDSCICQSDKCQSCQNTCTCQSDKCQSCQNSCNQCTDKCQKCQNACNQCTDKCQKCQNTCNQCTDKCQSCQKCQR